MRPVVITQATNDVSAAVPLDLYLTPFQVTIGCTVTGVVSYKLQYTYDNPFTVAAGDIVWRDATDIPAGTTANAESTFDNPVAALRLNKASGSGSVTATISQAGAR